MRSWLLLLFSVSINPVLADWQETLNQTLNKSKALGQKTLDASQQALEKSKQYGEQAVTASKQWYQQWLEQPESLLSVAQIEAEKQNQFKQTWQKILAQLDEGLRLHNKIESAPKFRFFAEDQRSLRQDLWDVFSVIETLLLDENIAKHRQTIDKLQQSIVKEQQRITELKEHMVVANEAEQKQQQQLDTAQRTIDAHQITIQVEKANIQQRFAVAGVNLSVAQLDILLTRVDANDMIKLVSVFDVLAEITQQLMKLTASSHENIQQARKYYGMHVVVLEFVMHLQQQYIQQLKTVYLPRIEQIIQQTEQLNQESQALLQTETTPSQQQMIETNIRAQNLTLSVAQLYRQQLAQQQQKIEQALSKVGQDHGVAKNTYDTVKISADLLELMNLGQNSFAALMQIQLPDIQPFENVQMQQKYQELSALIQ